MDALTFVVLALATWRITNLIVDDSEDGPWDVLHRWRHLIGVRYDDKNRPYGTNELARTFTCMWCGSWWVGVVVTGVALGLSLVPLSLSFFYPFALSAGALLINKAVKR